MPRISGRHRHPGNLLAVLNESAPELVRLQCQPGNVLGRLVRLLRPDPGLRAKVGADGFVSLSRADAGFSLIFLRTGLATFKPDSMRGRRADGLLVVFVVDDIDAEYARLQQEGVSITTAIETEPWGERFFQVTDSNGVVIQLVQWMTEPHQSV